MWAGTDSICCRRLLATDLFLPNSYSAFKTCPSPSTPPPSLGRLFDPPKSAKHFTPLLPCTLIFAFITGDCHDPLTPLPAPLGTEQLEGRGYIVGVKNITGWGHRVLSSVLLASLKLTLVLTSVSPGPGCSQALGEPTGPGIRVTFSAPWHFFCLLKLLAISVMEILVKPAGLNPYDSSESLAEHFESFRGWGPTPEIQIQSLEPG